MTDVMHSTDVETWRGDVVSTARPPARLAHLFGTDRDGTLRLTAVVVDGADVRSLDVDLPGDAPMYPALSPDLRAAFWYERVVHDLFGVEPKGHPRLDPLVLPQLDDGPVEFPRPGAATRPERIEPDEHALPRRVMGPGLFTIPHGPVRSGVVESVEYLVETPGEDIPHVQLRVFTKHRGVEKRFEGMTVDDGVLLAERAEGVASVAHALAFVHAVESLAGVSVPRSAGLVRVLHAELERIANHLDVAIRLADAAGLAVATARFGWHKERMLRLVGRCCGSRFGRSVVVPGGVRALPELAPDDLRRGLDAIQHSLAGDVRALMGSASFLDRLRTTGKLTPERASEHGALGPIGRASGFNDDARDERPYDAYTHLDPVTPPHRDAGDALARLWVRWDEVSESFRLLHQVIDLLGESSEDEALRVAVEPVDGRGMGWAEAPQGEVLYVVGMRDGVITRCAPRSASFHNLVLFHEVFGTDIFTDFPFIEASFGVSIAGVAL